MLRPCDGGRPMNPPVLDQIVASLAARPSVRRVILYGSRARGDNAERSDIDLAVEAPEATLREWSDIEESVENARTLLAIDLVRLDEASEEFRSRVCEEGKVLYERPQIRAEP
jgi:predicted nucleotidyltransferase